MFKSYGDFNFQQNQLINVVLENLATDPATGKEGQIYFNTATDAIKFHDGTKWRYISSVLNMDGSQAINVDVDSSDPTEVKYQLGLNINDAHLVIETDPTNTTKTRVGIKSGAIVESLLASNSVTTAKIKDSNVTTAKIANSNITTVKLADNAITFAKMDDLATMTVIGNMSATTSDPSAISVLTDLSTATEAAKTLATSYAIKAYVDAKISGLGDLKGGWDASSGTFPGSASTKKGDYWYVTIEGSISGTTYNVGDIVIAKENAVGNNANQYIALETNRDKATNTTMGLVKIINSTEAKTMTALGEDKVVTINTLITRTASETVTGLVELATQAEAEAGSDATRALTPKTGKALVVKLLDGAKYSTSVGDGSTSYVITHNLNNLTPQVTFYDSSKEMILCPYVVTDANKITFTAVPAPTSTAKITIAIS